MRRFAVLPLLVFLIFFVALGSAKIMSSSAATTPDGSDFNHDGIVNIYDLGIFLSKWQSTTATAQDLNSDGIVNIYDLGVFLSNYGQSVATSSNKLMWAPPALTSAVTINLPATDDIYSTTLDNSKDYILKLPDSARGPVVIKGGHNVVMIGGHIHMTSNTLSAGRLLYVMGNGGTTGTVHVEGVLLDRDEGLEADDIAINAPGKTVQIENIRGLGVRGDIDNVHGDVIQPWGGVANLRVDRLTASSNYQGLFLRPDLGAIGNVDLNHIDIAYDDYAPIGGGYLVWLTTDGGGTYGEIADSVKFNEVYLTRVRSASTFSHSIWPQVGATKGAVISNNQATWPLFPQVSGYVTYGTPANGSFVPDGVAGTSYVSPGYQ